MFPPSIDRLKKFKSNLLWSYQMIWKKKKKGRKREYKFRAIVMEAQLLAAFKTFFFNVALTLCLVGWNLGGMENIREKMWIFYCLESEENEREWKTKRKLSLRTHKFLSLQFGRKSW